MKRQCKHEILIITNADMPGGMVQLSCMNPKCLYITSTLIAAIPNHMPGSLYLNEGGTDITYMSGIPNVTGYEHHLGRVSNEPLAFFVNGNPAPQGSKRHVGNGVLVESAAPTLKPWRSAVTLAAREAAQAANWIMLNNKEPVRVDILFWLKAPSSVKRRLPSVKPDKDKLERAVLDGITNANFIIQDDAQIVEGTALKRYALPGMPLGANIWISPVIQ